MSANAIGACGTQTLAASPTGRTLSNAGVPQPKRVNPAVDPAAVRRARVFFVAVTFILLSAPQVLNAFRLLPLLVPLVLVARHLLARRRGQWLATRMPVIVWGLGLWLFVTCLWSDGQEISLIQCVATALVLVVAALIGSHCTLREIIMGLIAGGLAALALSLAVAVLRPSAGLMPAGYQGGALRGIFVHRNLLAQMLTPATVASLVLQFAPPYAAAKRLLCFLPLLGGVLLTRSSTALAAILAAVVLAVALAMVRRFRVGVRGLPLFLAFGGVGAALAALLANPTVVYALLQRDSTLTGRSSIWAAVRQLIAERSMEGYGWGATWGVGDPVRRAVESAVKFEVPSAHNGYLDAWLQAGLVGLVLFLFLIATVFFTGLRGALMSSRTEMTWGPVYVASLLVFNVAEASMVSALSILLLATTVVQRSAVPVDAEASRPTGHAKSDSNQAFTRLAPRSLANTSQVMTAATP